MLANSSCSQDSNLRNNKGLGFELGLGYACLGMNRGHENYLLPPNNVVHRKICRLHGMPLDLSSSFLQDKRLHEIAGEQRLG